MYIVFRIQDKGILEYSCWLIHLLHKLQTTERFWTVVLSAPVHNHSNCNSHVSEDIAEIFLLFIAVKQTILFANIISIDGLVDKWQMLSPNLLITPRTL